MKTILRGIELHDYLQFRTLIAKIVSCTRLSVLGFLIRNLNTGRHVVHGPSEVCVLMWAGL